MKTALLVIDYMNGIINNPAYQTYIAKHPIIENTNKLIDACRNKNIPIYFIRLGFKADHSDIPKHSKIFQGAKQNGKFIVGNDDTEFVSTLHIQPNDTVINKTGTSPFCGNNLMQQLNDQNIEHLIFTGVATDNAINIGTRQAHDEGFYTTIVEDACGAASEEFHQWALKMLEKLANEVVDTQTCIGQIN